MLEKLTLNNMDTFKEIYNKGFEKISYNKDFFRCYEEQNFLIKFLYRKSIRLIKVNENYVGYIWYEAYSGKYIKVWALYIDPSHRELINEYTLSCFNNNILSYEAIDSIENSVILMALGFRKENYTLLLMMHITDFHNKNLSLGLNSKVQDDFKYKINNNTQNKLLLRKLSIGKDEILRCNIQNDIFSQCNRRPLNIDDIYADMTQDYFLKDLCFFGMIDKEYIGYGQIIFNRNMYTIVNFGIVNKYRGMGLSKLFLSEIINAAKLYGIKELFIRVDSNNIKAINLYRWIGFEDLNKILIWERGE